ncbi:MAG: DNA-formamidopyrimidine glycosylase [Breznakia sp.]
MPELPEVETVVRTLEYQLQNIEISDVQITYEKVIDNVASSLFIERLKGQCFREYKRLGKYLIFVLDDVVLIAHMRMEGKFFVRQQKKDYDKKHVHIRFILGDTRVLHYHDTRKFGRFYLYPKQMPMFQYTCFKNVGYDVFDERVNGAYIYQHAKHRKITIKQFLLDQRVVAGIGNIYADEICFRIKIHPQTKVYRLSKRDCENILMAARYILTGAIKAGGTTIRSYTSSLGVDGRFQLELKVHNRQGEACYQCGTTLKKIVIGGRGTCFCKQCQQRK